MKIVNSIFIVAVLVASQACNQPVKQQEAVKADSAAVKVVDAKIADTANTAQVFSAYIALKNEFLKSNVAGIKAAASVLESKLIGIKGCSETATLTNKMVTTDDIKDQRAAFLTLSNDVIALIKGSKIKTAAIYVDFCPMADAGKGGYWLSLDKKIANPYFPEHMRECGLVKEQVN
ncbi:DUF3347 domain-containing protein [Mucilaginibacter sp. OK283]|jgi:Cu(I)/Ag(I) efflux system membrane fusion protein|uniref:DUF3347 domain-containing protein n=1 Tax=Mucilaginibacter sp. OK283 TaxID=1881049 RepID=UPI0008C944FE|nr:DUF3347 domain-containing protein [Mucilaginibacter sp. OK283]SEP34147.1 membrane fusion protein, Cu(I)/Ag(I) efflux system [Mucilaginibacter sp. OK283]